MRPPRQGRYADTANFTNVRPESTYIKAREQFGYKNNPRRSARGHKSGINYTESGETDNFVMENESPTRAPNERTNPTRPQPLNQPPMQIGENAGGQATQAADQTTEFGVQATQAGGQDTQVTDHTPEVADQVTQAGEQATHVAGQTTQVGAQSTQAGDQIANASAPGLVQNNSRTPALPPNINLNFNNMAPNTARSNDSAAASPAANSPFTFGAASSPAQQASSLGVRGRSEREKKESAKKRESKGIGSRATKKVEEVKNLIESPLRFKLPETVAPKDYQQKHTTFNRATTPNIGGGPFHELQDHPFDQHKDGKVSFKYTPCAPDDAFAATKFRATDYAPFGPRFSWEAHGPNMVFSEDGLRVSNAKGYETARTNVPLREGTFYWEIKILSNGIQADGTSILPDTNPCPGGNNRFGIIRVEGNLEKSVGGDGYGYGIPDWHSALVHDGIVNVEFFPKNYNIMVGDVIGFQLTLPPLEIHRKVVDGTYNPAVDGPETWSSLTQPSTASYTNVVRDRATFHQRKSDKFFFEAPNYDHSELGPPYNKTFVVTWKGFKEPQLKATPTSPNHPDPRYRTLPGSSLHVFHNGKYLGPAFENLLAFLLPASRMYSDKGRELTDDGSLGYYPAVSSYYGGATEIRLEAPFWFGPPTPADEAASANTTAKGKKREGKSKAKAAPSGFKSENPPNYQPVPLIPMVNLYNEAIAEDIVCDIVDEVEAAFADEMQRSVLAGEAAAAAAFHGEEMEVDE